jgi:hypothetical protein
MEGAFQTLLERVGEMGLSDGDFLRMNTLLKKAWDENKAQPSANGGYPRIKTKTHADFGRISIALCDKDGDELVRYELNSVDQIINQVVESTRILDITTYKLKWTAFHDGGAENEITAHIPPRGGLAYGGRMCMWANQIRNIAQLIEAHSIVVKGMPFHDEIAFDMGSVLHRMQKTASLEYEAHHEGLGGYEAPDYDLECAINHVFRTIDTYIMDEIRMSFYC